MFEYHHHAKAFISVTLRLVLMIRRLELGGTRTKYSVMSGLNFLAGGFVFGFLVKQEQLYC